MYIMKLKSEYFDMIKSGKITIEVRLNDVKRQEIDVGDSILFRKEPELFDGVVVKVVDKRTFATFLDMTHALNVKDLGFESGTSDEEVVNCYHSFYTPEDEAKWGVVAFRIELIN